MNKDHLVGAAVGVAAVLIWQKYRMNKAAKNTPSR